MYEFFGPTVVVTVASGQTLFGAAEAPLATDAGVATARAGLCYQLGSGTIANFAGFNYSVVEVDTTRTPIAAAAAITTLNGTYNVGFCVQNQTATAINDNDYVSGWVMLVN